MIRKVFTKLKLLLLGILQKTVLVSYQKKNKVRLPKDYVFGINSYMKAIEVSSINLDSGIYLGDFSKIIAETASCKASLGLAFRMKDYCSIRVINGDLNIGNNVFINNYSSINCLYKITIGDNVMIGENVRLYDHNHKYENRGSEQYIHPDNYTYGEIVIEGGCWIASNVTILKGVHIGRNTIIGAGITIHKSVPANSIVVNRQNLDIKKFIK